MDDSLKLKEELCVTRDDHIASPQRWKLTCEGKCIREGHTPPNHRNPGFQQRASIQFSERQMAMIGKLLTAGKVLDLPSEIPSTSPKTSDEKTKRTGSVLGNRNRPTSICIQFGKFETSFTTGMDDSNQSGEHKRAAAVASALQKNMSRLEYHKRRQSKLSKENRNEKNSSSSAKATD